MNEDFHSFFDMLKRKDFMVSKMTKLILLFQLKQFGRNHLLFQFLQIEVLIDDKQIHFRKVEEYNNGNVVIKSIEMSMNNSLNIGLSYILFEFEF